MGIDYITCSSCPENFPDCGDFALCTSCESEFCTDECAKLKNLGKKNKYDEELTTCVICRNEHISDDKLIKFLLKRCLLTRSKAIKLMKIKK